MMAKRDQKALSRSEAVRQRRGQQSQKRTERKIKRAQATPVVQNTPIFVRGGVIGTPVVQRTRTNVKKKISFQLQSGSEVIIPGLPMFKPGWRALSGFIFIALLVFLTLVNVTSVLDINEISVTGAQRVNPVDVSNVLNLKGKPIYLAAPQVILDRLAETFPEFYNVEVEITLPASVNILVEERQPVLSWQYENLTMWIDREGNIFSPRGTAEGIITIVANTAPPRLQIPMTDEEIRILRAELDEDSEDEIWLKDGPVDPGFIAEILDLQTRMPQISRLSYYTTDGFGWHDDENNWNVYFGHRLNNLDQKLLLYEHIKQSVLENGIHPGMISVAHLRAPFYRLEQ